ncbi:transporter substrate-binding domain-containing protein, partial [Aeromonas jandaei]|uniref:transporter substrate-binding domain-containing protein n=1 Tax=Aeromonas jandaei TaxID=650 RepID=UPI002AA0C77A
LYLYVRYILCCVILLFFHTQMSVCYAADNLPKPIVKVGILSDGFFPFQTLVKGRATGYSVELIELLAVKIDYNIVWRVYKDRASMYDALCKGDIDVQLDAFNSGALKCSSYSWPYNVSPTVVVIRQDSRLFKSLKDYTSVAVAIEKDSSIEKSLSMHYKN